MLVSGGVVVQTKKRGFLCHPEKSRPQSLPSSFPAGTARFDHRKGLYKKHKGWGTVLRGYWILEIYIRSTVP